MKKSFEELLNRLKRYTDTHTNVKNSKKREHVLSAIYDSKAHLSSDDIYKIVKEKYDRDIGIATVYRVLSFLEEAKLVEFITINGTKYYEINDELHHDHIICIRCGVVQEFCDKEIEKLQEEAARRLGFRLIDHKLTLFGVCEKCQKENV